MGFEGTCWTTTWLLSPKKKGTFSDCSDAMLEKKRYDVDTLKAKKWIFPFSASSDDMYIARRRVGHFERI